MFTQIFEEQHATIAEATAQIEIIHFHKFVVQMEAVPSNNMATQIEGWTVHNKSTLTISIQSHNKNTQTIKIHSHSKNMQTDIQAKDIMTRSDPTIANLQENLAQAWLTIERLEVEIVPQQR